MSKKYFLLTQLIQHIQKDDIFRTIRNIYNDYYCTSRNILHKLYFSNYQDILSYVFSLRELCKLDIDGKL